MVDGIAEPRHIQCLIFMDIPRSMFQSMLILIRIITDDIHFSQFMNILYVPFYTY